MTLPCNATIAIGQYLVMAVAAGFALPTAGFAEDLSDPETAVEAGRDALGDQRGLPWYDSQADDLRPLDLPPKKKRQSSSSSQWLSDFFSRLFSWNFSFRSFLNLLAWVALIALLVWVGYIIWKASAQYRFDANAVDDEDTEEDEARTFIERVEALPISVERKVTDLLAEARRLHAEGDLSLAIVYLYSHQLVTLDRHGLLRLVKGKTNRQYLRELRRQTTQDPAIGAILQETMLLFEGAFFGAHPPRGDRFEACLEAMQRFEILTNKAAGEL